MPFPPLLIREGLVVNATSRTKTDVLVRDGKIAAVGEGLSCSDPDTIVIDAQGTHVLPGGVDPHVHLSPFLDDFDSGSKTALAGGVTTIGIMSFAHAGEAFEAMLQRHAREAGTNSLVDVVLHGVVNAEGAPSSDVLGKVLDAGQTTFKIFTMLGNFDHDFPAYVDLLHRARSLRLLPMFHCEDRHVMREALRALTESRHGDFSHFEQSRPVLSEELAVHKVLALCELTRCPVYIVHVSSARALEACEAAQRRGLPVFMETRPIYLHFDSTKYAAPDGPLYVSFPPIRSAADSDALWRGLASGSIHTVGSDHAPLPRDQKTDPAHCLHCPRPGMSNLQEMLPVLYSEGVLKGRITIERFVETTSSNAAKLLGLYPRKGVIAAGADADVNIWDPEQRITVDARRSYSRADFSLYEGWTLAGAPRMTIRRGEIVCTRGELGASVGLGEVLRREPNAA